MYTGVSTAPSCGTTPPLPLYLKTLQQKAHPMMRQHGPQSHHFRPEFSDQHHMWILQTKERALNSAVHFLLSQERLWVLTLSPSIRALCHLQTQSCVEYIPRWRSVCWLCSWLVVRIAECWVFLCSRDHWGKSLKRKQVRLVSVKTERPNHPSRSHARQGGVVVGVGVGGPPRQRQWRHVHDSIRPIRLTVALGLNTFWICLWWGDYWMPQERKLS